jgi:hypothetical protein
MDSWIFADSLESGFKRIGFGWLFWTLAFQEFRISGFQDSWFPVFIRYRCIEKTKMQHLFDCYKAI